MTEQKRERVEKSPPLDWKTIVVSAVVSIILGAVYNFVSKPDILPMTLLFTALCAAAIFFAVTASRFGMRVERLKREHARITLDDPATSPRLDTKIDALHRSTRGFILASFLFAATVVTFIIAAPYLFGA